MDGNVGSGNTINPLNDDSAYLSQQYSEDPRYQLYYGQDPRYPQHSQDSWYMLYAQDPRYVQYAQYPGYVQSSSYSQSTSLHSNPSGDGHIAYDNHQRPRMDADTKVRPPKTISQQDSRKRKFEEKNQPEHGKRSKQKKTSDDFIPQKKKQGNVSSHNARQHGTQNNPFEIESSPEPKAKLVPKTKEPRLPPLGPRKDRGNTVNHTYKPDPTFNWPYYYAVAHGRVPGVYASSSSANEQVLGYSGGRQKKFTTQLDAWEFILANNSRLANNDDIGRAVQHLRKMSNTSCRPVSAQNGCMAQQTLSSSPPVVDTPRCSYAMPTEPFGVDLRPGKDGVPVFLQPSVLEQQQPLVQSSEPQLAPVDAYVPEPEPQLSAEQRRVVDLIVKDRKNVFYTGSAGCGKSTILKAFVRELKAKGLRVQIVAPTNLAALNVGGQTTWAFAGWTPDSMKKPLDKLKQAAHGRDVWKRFDSTDVLVVDEISMVENLLFERLNEIIKAATGESGGGRPFGGKQVVVTGDFCQLAPVKPFIHCMGCGWELIHTETQGELMHHCENKDCRYDMWPDADKWAFRSQAWQDCNFEHVNLTEIHRQNDRKFISILQKIRRDGIIVPNHAKILLNHTSETENAIKIFSLRRDVDRINSENVARLPSEPRKYHCLDDFNWKQHHRYDQSLEKYTRPGLGDPRTLYQLKDHRYDAYTELKEGMRVVLQSNLRPQSGLVNGAQGTIIAFEPFDPNQLPRKAKDPDDKEGTLRGPHASYAHQQIKAFANDNGRQPWPIVQFDNGLKETIYADCTYSELGNEEVVGVNEQMTPDPSLLSRTQIPLIAGYAITVHKSQGMTLDRVIVNLRDAFEPSQIYVAPSIHWVKIMANMQRHPLHCFPPTHTSVHDKQVLILVLVDPYLKLVCRLTSFARVFAQLGAGFAELVVFRLKE
ncbi:hypothetical protein BM1_00321 [Bipolaris maydis]|nr:hypothetical protein BM1_00321 [Bipolaris maydis]